MDPVNSIESGMLYSDSYLDIKRQLHADLQCDKCPETPLLLLHNCTLPPGIPARGCGGAYSPHFLRSLSSDGL